LAAEDVLVDEDGHHLVPAQSLEDGFCGLLLIDDFCAQAGPEADELPFGRPAVERPGHHTESSQMRKGQTGDFPVAEVSREKKNTFPSLESLTDVLYALDSEQLLPLRLAEVSPFEVIGQDPAKLKKRLSGDQAALSGEEFASQCFFQVGQGKAAVTAVETKEQGSRSFAKTEAETAGQEEKQPAKSLEQHNVYNIYRIYMIHRDLAPKTSSSKLSSLA
jgi:hypothetical protein